MGNRSKIFVLCGNRLLRESIAKILTKRTEFEIVATQAIHSASFDQVRDSGADVLVLDSLDFLLAEFGSPSAAGTGHRFVKSVLIAMVDDRSCFLTAIRKGARGYVLQDASAVDVVSAIRTVAEGHAVCPPHYTEVLFECVATQSEELPNSQKRAKWGLTRREQQLVPLIGRGFSNKEIANHFHLSEQTVKNHIHRILRKAGVTDRLSIYDVLQNNCTAPSTTHAGHSA